MKNYNRLLAVLGMLSALPVFGGERTGNGGITYVCRDQSGKITKARLLDLWEPSTFKPAQTNAVTEETQLENALAKIQAAEPNRIQYLKMEIDQAKANQLHVDKPLPLSNDALPDYTPEPGCQFEQVALYGWVNETGKYQLRIYDEIFNSPLLSNSDRAALWLHEGLYQIDSQFHDAQDSRRVRAITAEAFSSVKGFPLSGDRLDSLMSFQVDSEISISQDLSSSEFVLSIDAFSNGTATCSFSFQQNGRPITLSPNVTTETIRNSLYDGVIVAVTPGRLDFSLDCDGPTGVELRAYGNGKDITDSVLGKNARKIYNGQNLLTGESLAPIHYRNTILVNP